MTLEEVQKDVESQEQQVQWVSNEVERLKQQLASEKKNVSDTSMELQALKLELEKSKNEAEHLKLMERNFEERRFTRSKPRLELEDAKSTIAELKEELAYKSSVNRSLGLQLEKTIESNSELLLEIKDLDDLLQSKEREIEELKADLQERQGSQGLDDEKALWLIKLAESEQKRNELEKKILTLELTRSSRGFDDSIQDLRADNDMLQKELEKAETVMVSTSKENMNLLSQLMDLRHQTDEKSTLMQQLEQRLAMVQTQSSLEVQALETKASDLQATANDLREKLCLSEELSQSQLDSNKVFMEDLISTVEELRARNEQLEALLKSSEEKCSGLVEELEVLQSELDRHEKEQSLLVSQRGQLKILREKIATLTENYENALEREENLEIAIKASKEEHSKALANFEEQLKQLEEKLHNANTESMALKAEVQKVETQAAEMRIETNVLLVAKEAAEANTSSLDAAYTELQNQYDSLLVDKEKADASLSSLHAAHTELQDCLKGAQHSRGEAVLQLQERDFKIVELTEALNSAENQLKGACEKTSELEATAAALQKELQHTQDEKRLQDSHIAEFELKLAKLKEDMDESRKSLSTSKETIQTLQVSNSDLSEMLQSAVSYKEDVVSKLESTLAKEVELEKRLQETQQALENLKSEKVTSEKTIEELQERICQLKDGSAVSVKGKENDGDVRELHKILRTQVEVLKHSMHELKLEKERAETSLQKLQTANTNLSQELKKWKEKVKAGSEELALWKEKVKISKRLSTSVEEKTSQAPDFNTKGAKKNMDLEQKSELLKLRKQAADLRRKLLEQEEEKEDFKKKLLSYQKEVQRKSELVNLTEKRLKDKEKEQRAGQRPPTRHTSTRRIGLMDLNGEKTTIDHLDKIKSLEAELNIKTVELEAIQFLLKEKEGGPDRNLNVQKNEATDGHVNQSPEAEQQLLMDVGSHKTFYEEVQGLQSENQRLRNLLLEHKEQSKSESSYTADSLERKREEEDEQCAEKAHLQEELREMKERYSQMSLQFAELQIEKEELLVTIRTSAKMVTAGCKMKSLARGLSRHKTTEKGTMSDSELDLQDQTPPTNQLVRRSSPSKVEVKVKAVPGTLECVASNSKQSTKSLKALEYPRLSKFCFSAEELHEEYGLSLEGKLPKELSDKDIPNEEWLSVFKCLHKKNTKLFLNHVRDEFVDECRLLYQKHGKAVVKSGDRVEDPEAEPFVVENHGKETIGQDSSKLSTDNQEGSLEIADKVEDAEDVETLLIIADTLKKRKRQQEEGVHHPDPKKIKIQVIGNVGHRHCAQEDLGHFDRETPLLTQFRVPHLSEDNRPALIININDLLIVTHDKREGPSPPIVDMLHFGKVKQDDNLIHYVHYFPEWFVLGASQIVEVYVWNTSRCQDLEKRLELCLPHAHRCLNGWIAKEACSRSSWLDEQGDQMLFLILGTFWKEFPQFNKDNTLLLDDKYLSLWFLDYWLAIQAQVLDWLIVSDYWLDTAVTGWFLVTGSGLSGYWSAVTGLWFWSLWLLVCCNWTLVSPVTGLVSNFLVTSLVSSFLWDHIEQLAREKNLDELEWLIRLLTTSDPYPVEDMHPIAQIYPLAQVDYTRLVRFLVLLCEEDDEDIEDDWTDMSHGMTDNDFIYLDDEDRA
ncbi:hypothetical protein L7F22_047121 [Adiantum nelumboides]|nr:hypothetical protein [Adiantum nelumboides]